MSDIPSSPRKTVSSVSANARTQQPQKKPGAPKPKGAVRAKSGCYTCRIRRKKCDEQPNGEGACQTCVRLRLQCLGFGAKRPDWMRENNSVTELREKIKTFLASQGMIKGHSGSGPRSNDGDPPVLVLVENLQPQPASPPTPTLSAASNEQSRQQQQQGPGQLTSYVRDPRDPAQYHHPSSMPPDQHSYASQSQQQQQQPQTTWASHLPELTSHPHPHPHDASSLGRGPLLPNDILYSTQPNTILSPPSLVPPAPLSSSASTSWQSSTTLSSYAPSSVSMSANHNVVVSPVNPSLQSSFGPHYTVTGYGSDDDLQTQTSPDESMPLIPVVVNSYDVSIPFEEQDLVRHYMSTVLPIQYLLSDQSSIRNFIYDLIRSSPLAREAACTLAAIHRNRIGYAPHNSNSVVPAQRMFQRLIWNLVQKEQTAPTQVDEGDAMAGLHAISTILFSGGRGSWNTFLTVASRFVYNVLTNNNFVGPEEVLTHCNESTRFIIKTTMWFDVLSSVTTQSVPRFLKTYRELFDHSTRAHVEDPYSQFRPLGHPTRSPPATSMLPVMGCENNIVLAIAEISNLACWKESQANRNSLSVPKLVELGRDIESKFLGPGSAASSPTIPRHVQGLPPHMAGTPSAAGMYGGLGLGLEHGGYGGGGGVNGLSSAARAQHSRASHEQAEVELRRSLTNDIFRASAKLYLHTVLSGDFPLCPEIKESVTDVVECLRRIPHDRVLVSRSVLRSVVFGICIAGCLTEDPQQRAFLIQLLESQERESVGNLGEVKKLMQRVWTRRQHTQGPVNWRQVMSESQNELLLLV